MKKRIAILMSAMILAGTLAPGVTASATELEVAETKAPNLLCKI